MYPTTTELLSFLKRFHLALQNSRVFLSAKSEDEYEEMGWSAEQVWEQLDLLASYHFNRREESRQDATRWIWVFCPITDHEQTLWIRITEYAPDFLIISFHQARGNPW